MGLSDQPFEVMCPDCGAMLTVDPGDAVDDRA